LQSKEVGLKSPVRSTSPLKLRTRTESGF